MKYDAHAYRNVGPNRMWRISDGDPVVRVGRFTVEAGSVEEALEVLWAVGNRMAQDANGNIWPSDHPSMSMGDVVLIRVSDGSYLPPFTSYVAVMVGWEMVADQHFPVVAADPLLV